MQLDRTRLFAVGLIAVCVLGSGQRPGGAAVGAASAPQSAAAQKIDLAERLGAGKLKPVNREVTKAQGSPDGVHLSEKDCCRSGLDRWQRFRSRHDRAGRPRPRRPPAKLPRHRLPREGRQDVRGRLPPAVQLPRCGSCPASARGAVRVGSGLRLAASPAGVSRGVRESGGPVCVSYRLGGSEDDRQREDGPDLRRIRQGARAGSAQAGAAGSRHDRALGRQQQRWRLREPSRDAGEVIGSGRARLRLAYRDLGGQHCAGRNHARHAAIAVGQMGTDFEPTCSPDAHPFDAVEETVDQ